MESTKRGPAKYLPGTNIQALERNIWAKGIEIATPRGKNTKWKIQDLGEIIGASEGKETKYMRVECSQGVIHGHPISKAEFTKLMKRVL
ncbi:hypothetical protein [Acinetobacter equi]|uniref:Uncharacterized protein n=1 Tax=Acinetobacter equi TaxID=1324350 RepID=A0A0N9VDT4_9GAMM|nr:hypothetical protein [Acinetobacter equi]ALH95484.1 hypothetical protein AOY20_08050 [Acinetobacter equi]